VDGLRDRAKKTAEQTNAIAEVIRWADLPIDDTANLAVEAGKEGAGAEK